MLYKKIRDVKSPERGTQLSAGIDFFIPNDFVPTVLQPNSDILIPSGIQVNFNKNAMLIAKNKSGVATSKSAVERIGRVSKPTAHNTSLIVGAEVVDADYQGEVHIHLINVGSYPVKLEPGLKIAQFVLVPILYDMPQEVPSDMDIFQHTTDRGDGGFGSTDTLK